MSRFEPVGSRRACRHRPWALRPADGPGLAAICAGLVIALTALAGCSDDDASSASDVPSGAVAKVGDREIGKDDLERQVEALARAQRSSASGRGAAAGDRKGSDDRDAAAQRALLRDQALAQLLMREAIEQEADQRGVTVSDEEVLQRWEAAVSRQFKTKKALRRFLGGQTEEDVLDQLRLQMLYEGVFAKIAEEAGGGKQGRRAVRHFQREFRRRWADRTVCAEGYDAAGCTAGDAE